MIRKSGTGTKGTKIDETTVKESGPDLRYLDAAVRAYADIRAIWSVDAPKKTALTNENGQGPPLIEVVVGNREEAAGSQRSAIWTLPIQQVEAGKGHWRWIRDSQRWEWVRGHWSK